MNPNQVWQRFNRHTVKGQVPAWLRRIWALNDLARKCNANAPFSGVPVVTKTGPDSWSEQYATGARLDANEMEVCITYTSWT